MGSPGNEENRRGTFRRQGDWNMKETKTALITGASSGIGESYARTLAEDGYNLIISARRENQLNELAARLEKEWSIKVSLLPADLSNPAGIEKFIAGLDGISIDLFIHSAGFGTRGLFANVNSEKSGGMVVLHTLAATLITRAVLPGMVDRQSGGIIFVSSLGAFLTTAEYTVYSATKAYLNTFIEGLRDETLPFGVHVQAVCPGLTKTEFMSTDEYAAFDYSSVPDWAWMDPDRVARVSLKQLKRNRAIVVPGFGNRLFIGIMRLPFAGRIIRGLMSASSRKRVARGEQALF